MAEADRVVAELWDIIVAVATELRARRVLTGDEITTMPNVRGIRAEPGRVR
jgi:hypothetical protein